MRDNKTAFSFHIWLIIASFATCSLFFFIYVRAEKQIDHANELRHQSFLLADELRQSSNNLTNMARAFVTTGDPIYKKYYEDILLIRDGKKPRPHENYNLYWDLVLATGQVPANNSDQAAPLLDLMKNAGFSKTEFQQLDIAKQNSDRLTDTEFEAMRLTKSTGSNAREDHERARKMMFDPAYYQAKADIMIPISTFYSSMDKRTLAAVQYYSDLATFLRWVFIAMGLGLIIILLRMRRAFWHILGGSVDEIHAHITRIGNGDIFQPIPVEDALKNSMLGRLATTQINLNQVDHERKKAKKYEQFHREMMEKLATGESLQKILYALVVGVENLSTDMICSILMLDNDGLHLGRGIAPHLPDFYNKAVSGLAIGMGAGSCGTAAYTGHRIIVTDIARHPYWAPYKEIAAKAGVNACWSQPILSSSGQIFGTFAIYHHDIHSPTEHDITLIEQAAHLASIVIEKNRSEEDLRIAATAFESQEGMFVTDADDTILRVNKAFTRITGYTAQETIGHYPSMLKSDRHDDEFYKGMLEKIAQDGFWQNEFWAQRKNGEIFPQWLTITAVKNDAGQITHHVATFTDITQRKEAENQIKSLAFYDPLTKLPNRRLLMDRLKHALTTSTRRRRHGALLLIDLDNFKAVNDTLGHDKGDLLLQQIAELLLSCVRADDTVARLGGDEFVVIIEDLSESAVEAGTQAKVLGEKILSVLSKTYQLASYTQHSTPSIGVTLFLDLSESVDELLKRVDLALYQAKAAGRNALRFFDPQMQAVVTARVEMEASLRQAIDNEQFTLYYQPQMTSNNNGTDYPTGAEALVRWNNPVRGMVSPAEFIPLAEETGLILPLGKWILETACKQLACWATQAEMEHISLAVNVSSREFHKADFVNQVLAVLKRTGARPQRLKLELTESLLITNVEDIITKMTALRKEGVCFSLDDFGTGYSSLSYLKRLPLHQLKIDQGFVRDILIDPNDAAIAQMVIVLAGSLGLEVIAEGVETETQRNFLAEHGCHSYQGYLYSRPLPLNEFETWVHIHQP